MIPPHPDPWSRIVHELDPQAVLLRTWQPPGGVSAQVTVLEFARPGCAPARAAVRRHGSADLARDPHIAAHEYALLQMLAQAGMAVPAPRLLDESCTLFPTPFLVMAYIPGAPVLDPADPLDFVRQMSLHLARLHRVDWRPLPFLRRLEPEPPPPAAPDESLGETRIRAALARHGPPPGPNPPALLHGDYWPGNLLWQDERLAAVVDWEDAAVGDPLADVANARLELRWSLGATVMEAFTRAYRALQPLEFAHLPYWDLRAALRPAGKLHTWGLDAATQAAMRRAHTAFVEQALAHLES